MGVSHLPLEISVIIHTQVSLLTQSSTGTKYYKILPGGQTLQVGQTVQMVFVPLYSTSKIEIQSITYYRGYERNSLPAWMTFLVNRQMILMTVDKEGTLNTFSSESHGENVIILEMLRQLHPQDFTQINPTSQIPLQMASLILKTLSNQGYISRSNFLLNTFIPQLFTRLDFYNPDYPLTMYAALDTQIQQKIKQVLTFSRMSQPIRFFIQSSLKFNYKEDLTTISLLQTPSYSCSVQMSIKSNAKFVRKIFQGVLSSFADDLTSVKIEGPTDKVNEIVSKSLQIANSTSILHDISITAHISDSNNYDLQFTENLPAFTFLKLNNPVRLDPQLSLQSQFEGFFYKGEVYIEEKFQFTFDSRTFTDADSQSLVYTAFIITDVGHPIEITQGSQIWIEFTPSSLVYSQNYQIISYSYLKYSRLQPKNLQAFLDTLKQSKQWPQMVTLTSLTLFKSDFFW